MSKSFRSFGSVTYFCAKILRTGRTSSAAVAFCQRVCRQPSANSPVPSKFGHSVRTLRPHTCLIFPFVCSGNLARKTVLPAKKLKRLQQKGKLKIKNQINKRLWTIKDFPERQSPNKTRLLPKSSPTLERTDVFRRQNRQGTDQGTPLSPAADVQGVHRLYAPIGIQLPEREL